MTDTIYPISRRQLLQSAAAASIALKALPTTLLAADSPITLKRIPSSAEMIPVIGLGTHRVFAETGDAALFEQRKQLLQLFFDRGGRVIDSSPMYGSAEQVTGDLLKQVNHGGRLFAATKVWTYGRDAGIKQMNESMQKMGVEVMDLMQIHNLRDWQLHMPTLKEWKAQGKIRYIGITTSSGRNHDEFAKLMQTEPLDFVQFTYSLANHEVEKRLLPLAADRGIAVLANRPFEAGSVFKTVQGKPLPGWAEEIDCKTWAQVFLKYVASHPDVSCVIPATSKESHMHDNMAAGYGRMPDAAMRKRIRTDFEALA